MGEVGVKCPISMLFWDRFHAQDERIALQTPRKHKH